MNKLVIIFFMFLFCIPFSFSAIDPCFDDELGPLKIAPGNSCNCGDGEGDDVTCPEGGGYCNVNDLCGVEKFSIRNENYQKRSRSFSND
jgi:hypothetical protein